MRYVALDVGSTRIKCAALDTRALAWTELAGAAFPAPLSGPATRFEVDAEALLRLCAGLLDAALDACPDSGGVLFSVQMHGFVITDGRDRPLTGYVSWRDAACRETGPDGLAHLERMRGQLPQDALAATGMPLREKLGLSNLYARLQGGLVLPEGAVFHTLGGFLIRRLGGERCCHQSSAAATGLYDACAGQWSQTLIHACGAQRLRFPRVEAGFACAGEYARGGRAYALYPDVGDQQVCVMGSLARPLQDVNVNVGTGGMVGRIVDGFQRCGECRPLLFGRYVRTQTGLPAGRHAQALVDAIVGGARLCGGAADESAVWARIAGLAPTSSPLCAAFGPGDALMLQGAFHPGLSVQDVVNAFYQGMAERYAQAVTGMHPGARRLAFSGGAVERNPALRGHIERACGLPQARCGRSAAMAGLLQLALIAQGACAGPDEARAALEAAGY